MNPGKAKVDLTEGSLVVRHELRETRRFRESTRPPNERTPPRALGEGNDDLAGGGTAVEMGECPVDSTWGERSAWVMVAFTIKLDREKISLQSIRVGSERVKKTQRLQLVRKEKNTLFQHERGDLVPHRNTPGRGTGRNKGKGGAKHETLPSILGQGKSRPVVKLRGATERICP